MQIDFEQSEPLSSVKTPLPLHDEARLRQQGVRQH